MSSKPPVELKDVLNRIDQTLESMEDAVENQTDRGYSLVAARHLCSKALSLAFTKESSLQPNFEGWWQKKHKEDCVTLSEIVHKRTRELIDVKKVLAGVIDYLEKVNGPSSIVDVARCSVSDLKELEKLEDT